MQLRDDILDEVTRLYFERGRLQELTADIDGLTGGYLSRRLREG